ncbi:MAG: hypothetical protein ACTHKG_10215 [Nocardioides sp.]
MDDITLLLQDQGGVISRRQVLSCGGDDNLIERRLRRREWARVHPGVFVDHTGPLTWHQRAWAAVLYYWPAALSHQSALDLHTGRAPGDPTSPIHVAIDARRRQVERDGVSLHRVTALDERIQPSRLPPRVHFDEAVLQVASDAADEAAAVAVLADACQSRRTTAARLAASLGRRTRLPRRHFLAGVLVDVATGAYSILEHRYLTRVERPHGLPRGVRQRRVRPGRRVAFRDVEYLHFRTVVELDGRLGHELAADRWDDLDRDIDSAVAGDTTIRVGWRQVLDPCRLAGLVARLLSARGWTGELRSCGPDCTAARVRG